MSSFYDALHDLSPPQRTWRGFPGADRSAVEARSDPVQEGAERCGAVVPTDGPTIVFASHTDRLES